MPEWILPTGVAALLALIGWTLRRVVSHSDHVNAAIHRIDVALATMTKSIENVNTRNDERLAAHEQLDTHRFESVNDHLQQSDRIVDGRFEDTLRRLDAQHASLVEGLQIVRGLGAKA